MENRRRLLGVALGAGLASLAHCGRRFAIQRPGPAVLWVADAGLGRGPEGGALVGLDADGLVREVLRLPAPLALARRAGRGWVLVDAGSAGRSSLELWEWSRLGVRSRQGRAGPFALDPSGSPWVLTGDSQRGQSLLDPGGDAALCTRGAVGLVPGAGGVWLGNRAGELFCAGGGRVSRTDLGVALLGLAPGPGGPIWAGRDASGRLLLRHGAAAPWAVPRPLEFYLGGTHSLQLAAGRGGAVWIAGAGKRRVVLVRSDSSQVLGCELEASARRLCSDGHGGVVALMPGGIAWIDRRAMRRPGQGGFASCQDLWLRP